MKKISLVCLLFICCLVKSHLAVIDASSSVDESYFYREKRAAEPETKVEGEPETKVEGEPETKVEGEPETKVETEPEKETKPESETESETKPENKPESEVESETKPETTAKPETNAEGTVSPEAEPEQRPSMWEIILPPFILLVLIVLGLTGLSISSQRHVVRAKLRKIFGFCLRTSFLPAWKNFSGLKTIRKINVSPTESTSTFETSILSSPDSLKRNQAEDVIPEEEEDKTFLSSFDLEVIRSMNSYHNRPKELFRISFPALISLSLCPFTLYLYQPLIDIFWPKSSFATPPDINEAIACFLAPAGLVYATSFGFAFQQALGKQGEVLRKITYELGLIDQIATLASKIHLPNIQDRMAIYRAIKAEAIFMILQIEDREPESFQNKSRIDVKTEIWNVLDILRRIQSDSKEIFSIDRIIVDKIISHILHLNSICSDRMGLLHARIHPLKWAFLETLGFFSFFGILLLTAQSYRMELIMCIITVFSISLLCYVVSDLDSPFSGFFRIDLSVLPDAITRIEKMFYIASSFGLNITAKYPTVKKMF
ncbi:DgyrCDS12355 [Dimorphilus gyrociliatus]|uniref:DgyrCDS12355 n=1 Tax=Dimorphilus gyrociliatus TaxID=2664684 RepID=A0A7I8W697_9ANNE|nr:DgyrCDS12355 [Dimorphilus gyrociliatus]